MSSEQITTTWAPRISMKTRDRLTTALVWLAVASGAVIMFFPVYWMFVTTIVPREEAYSRDLQPDPADDRL